MLVSPPLRSGLSFGARAFRAQPTIHPHLLRNISSARVRGVWRACSTLYLFNTPYSKTLSLRSLVKRRSVLAPRARFVFSPRGACEGGRVGVDTPPAVRACIGGSRLGPLSAQLQRDSWPMSPLAKRTSGIAIPLSVGIRSFGVLIFSDDPKLSC